MQKFDDDKGQVLNATLTCGLYSIFMHDLIDISTKKQSNQNQYQLLQELLPVNI